MLLIQLHFSQTQTTATTTNRRLRGFNGDEAPERRSSGTIVGVGDAGSQQLNWNPKVDCPTGLHMQLVRCLTIYTEVWSKLVDINHRIKWNLEVIEWEFVKLTNQLESYNMELESPKSNRKARN